MYLVKWKNLSYLHNSWEMSTHLQVTNALVMLLSLYHTRRFTINTVRMYLVPDGVLKVLVLFFCSFFVFCCLVSSCFVFCFFLFFNPFGLFLSAF